MQTWISWLIDCDQAKGSIPGVMKVGHSQAMEAEVRLPYQAPDANTPPQIFFNILKFFFIEIFFKFNWNLNIPEKF